MNSNDPYQIIARQRRVEAANRARSTSQRRWFKTRRR
jgi:hypothetical protein